MSRRRAPHSSAATPSTATSFASSNTADSGLTQARMGQILDDQDHKRCSEGNQRALLAENLDQLRGLVKVLEADDWKYAPSGAVP
jgi:surface antigen